MARETRRPPGTAQPTDLVALIDRLAELANEGRRVPIGGRIMIDEQEFFDTLDQMRLALPSEIAQARRVVQDRQRVILEAQTEADRIISVAKERAAYEISERGLTNEARAISEDAIRHSREQARRSMHEIDAYALRILESVEHVIRDGLDNIELARKSIGPNGQRAET